MSAKRITVFKCDTCGKEKQSPNNYDLPEGWDYENPAGKPSSHTCTDCQ